MKVYSIFVWCLLCVPVCLYAQGDTRSMYGDNPGVGSYRNVNGVKLYYEVYGKGEPVVLLHGNGGSIRDMGSQIDFFSKDYQVIVIDSRGHGKSELGAVTLSYRQMADDVAALLGQLAIGKVNIIGWSDGGIIGLHLAIHYPERVGKLVVFGANIDGGPEVVHEWVHPLDQQTRLLIEKNLLENDTSKDWRKEKILFDLVVGQPGISESDLNKIKSPVLVMAGDRDFIAEEHTLVIYRNIKNSHLAILPGETHFAPISDSGVFNEMAKRFIANAFTRPDSRDFTE